jgi:hypothetical protein
MNKHLIRERQVDGIAAAVVVNSSVGHFMTTASL